MVDKVKPYSEIFVAKEWKKYKRTSILYFSLQYFQLNFFFIKGRYELFLME